jgi:hypothetical protein
MISVAIAAEMAKNDTTFIRPSMRSPISLAKPMMWIFTWPLCCERIFSSSSRENSP